MSGIINFLLREKFQCPDVGKLNHFLIKINTAYCDKFLRNTPRNLIWNNIDYILYNIVR